MVHVLNTLDRLKNARLSVPGFSMFRLADGKT